MKVAQGLYEGVDVPGEGPVGLITYMRTDSTHLSGQALSMAREYIERGDFDHLQGELGDLLFQVVYYSQLAREEGRFEFAGVIDSITRKLIRRHPHVFPTGDLYAPLDIPQLSEEQVKQRWEQIKAEERAEKRGRS